MKVALVLCPSWDSRFSTYALASLASGLGARGHEAEIFDLNQVFFQLARASSASSGAADAADDASLWMQPSFVRGKMEEHAGYLESFVDDVLARGHRVVGFSVYFSTLRMSLEIARLFKRKDPRIVVVFGGSHYLKFERCRKTMADDCVDAVAYGEADLSFPDFIDRLERTGRPGACPGILLRDDASTWKETKPPLPDLDALPFADFKAHRLGAVRAKTINTSRGCVRKCDFCSEWRQMGFRQKSAERVHQEVRRQLADHPGIQSFMFADSLVNGVPKEFELLCERMIRDPLGISWGGYAIIRPEMTRAVLDRTRQTGCGSLFYGVESGSERLRRLIGKNTPDALIASVLRETVASGINTVVGCIAGHPRETESDFERTLSFLEANAGGISLLHLSAFGAQELEGEEESYGLLPLSETTPWLWRTKDGSNTLPVRIERVRRLARAACELGIEALFENRANGRIDARCDEMLERYRRSG
ncbi:MAG: B12-binding domain-containing radical SAM protein [Elusimicrobiota bacterium]